MPEEPRPCGLSLTHPNPFAWPCPDPKLQIPWEKGRIQPPFHGGSHHGPGGRRGDIRVDIIAWGHEGHGWRPRRSGGTKGPGEPGGTIRDKALGPGPMLSHGAGTDIIRGQQDGHCHQVGAPEDTAATGKQRRRGWGWPGETCSPALCCMTVIKLLPFVMVPRGGVNQLLIKTDGSEVASPEPLYPWNFGKSPRGCPEPAGRAAAPSPRGQRRQHPAMLGTNLLCGGDKGDTGEDLGGLGGCREPEQPRGGKGRPEGLRGAGKQREEEKSSSNCPLKFMKAVKKQSAARAPGCC